MSPFGPVDMTKAWTTRWPLSDRPCLLLFLLLCIIPIVTLATLATPASPSSRADDPTTCTLSVNDGKEMSSSSLKLARAKTARCRE